MKFVFELKVSTSRKCGNLPEIETVDDVENLDEAITRQLEQYNFIQCTKQEMKDTTGILVFRDSDKEFIKYRVSWE